MIINIQGIGKVKVDDSFKDLPKERQEAFIRNIVKSGGNKTPSDDQRAKELMQERAAEGHENPRDTLGMGQSKDLVDAARVSSSRPPGFGGKIYAGSEMNALDAMAAEQAGEVFERGEDQQELIASKHKDAQAYWDSMSKEEQDAFLDTSQGRVFAEEFLKGLSPIPVGTTRSELFGLTHPEASTAGSTTGTVAGIVAGTPVVSLAAKGAVAGGRALGSVFAKNQAGKRLLKESDNLADEIMQEATKHADDAIARGAKINDPVLAKQLAEDIIVQGAARVSKVKEAVTSLQIALRQAQKHQNTKFARERWQEMVRAEVDPDVLDLIERVGAKDIYRSVWNSDRLPTKDQFSALSNVLDDIKEVADDFKDNFGYHFAKNSAGLGASATYDYNFSYKNYIEKGMSPEEARKAALDYTVKRSTAELVGMGVGKVAKKLGAPRTGTSIEMGATGGYSLLNDVDTSQGGFADPREDADTIGQTPQFNKGGKVCSFDEFKKGYLAKKLNAGGDVSSPAKLPSNNLVVPFEEFKANYASSRGRRAERDKRKTFKDFTISVAELTPIIGDAMAAKEVYDELKKPEPNWLLVGALGGAALIGLIPGLGDAASAAIKAGARKGLSGVKAAGDLVSRIEVDPNTLGSLGGNIRLKPTNKLPESLAKVHNMGIRSTMKDILGEVEGKLTVPLNVLSDYPRIGLSARKQIEDKWNAFLKPLEDQMKPSEFRRVQEWGKVEIDNIYTPKPPVRRQKHSTTKVDPKYSLREQRDARISEMRKEMGDEFDLEYAEFLLEDEGLGMDVVDAAREEYKEMISSPDFDPAKFNKQPVAHIGWPRKLEYKALKTHGALDLDLPALKSSLGGLRTAQKEKIMQEWMSDPNVVTRYGLLKDGNKLPLSAKGPKFRNNTTPVQRQRAFKKFTNEVVAATVADFKKTHRSQLAKLDAQSKANLLGAVKAEARKMWRTR